MAYCLYKSISGFQTATCRLVASVLHQAMNLYPNFHLISRFDIQINEKFDINITITNIH